MATPVLIGGLVLIGAAVAVLVSNLFSTIEKNSIKGEIDTTLQVAAVEANLAPIGKVNAVDKSIVKEARSGEAVYTAACVACHASGVLGAPKIDDKGAWDARVANGLDGLMKNAVNGLNSMPARGGDPSITDEELSNAIVYMTGKAGHNLAAPAAGGAAPVQAAAPAAEAAPVQAAAPATPTAGIDGEKVYKGICFSCHDVGVAGSPKLGDKAAWAPRIATGAEAMYATSLNGKGAMPAKGGNPALSDDEIKAAVDYMIAQSQ
jgi:cytochrome c5